MSKSVSSLLIVGLLVLGFICNILFDLLMDFPYTCSYCIRRVIKFLSDFLESFKKMILLTAKRAWKIEGTCLQE